MSNVAETTAETNNVVVSVPSIQPIKVTRNDVELEYKESELKKGPNKGWKYPAVKVTTDNLQKVIGYMGVDKIIGKVQTIFSQLAQGWWEEAIEDATNKVTGLVDYDKAVEAFTKLAVDFSSRGESIPDLKARIEELVDEMTNLDPTADNWAEEFKLKSAEIKDLRKSLDEKRRPRAAKPATTEDSE